MAVYRRVRVSEALVKSGLYDIDYALNPYAGCEHGCRYCYARAYTRYREAAENWGQVVYIKENIVEVLEREVVRKKRGVVGVSTITDPYQPIERTESLTRACLEVLLRAGFQVSIQTKSDLVLRDLDLLSEHRDLVDVGFTITTMDREVASVIEPGAPPPEARARALREVVESGIETWVFLGPIMCGVNDSENSIRRVIELAAETGSTLYYDYLRLRAGVAEALAELKSEYPHAARFARRWWQSVEENIRKLCSELGVKCVAAFPPRRESLTLDRFFTR